MAFFRELKASFVKVEHQSGGRAIKPVGDTAVWIQKIEQLSAWQHGYSVSITVFGPYVTSPLSAAKTLTKAALAHL